MQSTPEERLDALGEPNKEIKDDSQNFNLSCQEDETPLPPHTPQKNKAKILEAAVLV